MRLTEREFKAWQRWLLSEHEKCPLCGRPMPSYREKQRGDHNDDDYELRRFGRHKGKRGKLDDLRGAIYMSPMMIEWPA